jgi:hypothetical protein
MLQSVTLKQSGIRATLSLQADKSYAVVYTDTMLASFVAISDIVFVGHRPIAAQMLIDAGYVLRRNDFANGGDRVTLPGWMSAEMANALLTAENHATAYRVLGDDGEGTNIQARCELAREIAKHHPDLSKADRQTVAGLAPRSISGIADANN